MKVYLGGNHEKDIAALVAAASIATASNAFAGTLVINTDTSDPAPKKAFEYIIEKFEAENPDVTVEWNLFDHEGYKQSIRNFLNTNPPDVANWYAGNRMRPFVKAGLFEDVSDIWQIQDGRTAICPARWRMRRNQ